MISILKWDRAHSLASPALSLECHGEITAGRGGRTFLSTMMSRDLATKSAHSFFYSSAPLGSPVFAYAEIEQLVSRVEAWEHGTVGAAAVLAEDAEDLARRMRAVISGPRSPRRRVEEEMARVAQRIEHLERAWKDEPRVAVPLFPRIRWRMRKRFRRWRDAQRSQAPPSAV